MKRICVQWPRFGPYHIVRLKAAHAYCAGRGVELFGMETAGDDATYAWRVERDPVPFPRIQAFPGRVYDTIPPADVHAAITATLDRIDPDIVFINSYSHADARASMAWCRRHRRGAAVIMSTTEQDVTRSAWKERMKRVLIGQFDAALAAGSRQRDYLTRLGLPSERIFFTSNAVDNAFFRNGAAAARRTPQAWRHLPGLGDPTPFFLTSNRFVKRKNLDGLLDAYARYRDGTAQPWRLLLLGDGAERSRLEAIVEERSIGGVTFCGFRQIEELPAYYGLASAFVHPTWLDQWGLVINEAMATGLPVVVSDRSGCAPDLVHEGRNGFAFDPADPEALPRLLARLAATPASERHLMGKRSQEIVARWAPERFAEGLWQAAETAERHSDRPFEPSGRLLLRAIRLVARSTTSFHAIKD